MIDRDQARHIALSTIKERGLGFGVNAVHRRSEVPRPPCLYGGPDLEQCWIVYVARPIRGLEASTVVLVSMTSGEILYAGSANDEG
jgi:hypothetical protein